MSIPREGLEKIGRGSHLKTTTVHTKYNLILVGGGLSSGLAAYRLKERRPETRLLIIEQAEKLGGEHTWSFHSSDMTPHQRHWIEPFISKTWTSYDILFPQMSRTLQTTYHSIRSSQFHKVLVEPGPVAGSVLLKTKATVVSRNEVQLEDGQRLLADCVLDARGWTERDISCGYQKFFGLDVTLTAAHGLTRPLLMDASVKQEDGFRFFYLLPWSDRSLLIEDTRYSNTDTLPKEEMREAIKLYIQNRGWVIASIDREEQGVLPIPLGGASPALGTNLPVAGTRAGLFHATTGYSLPDAVRFADAFSSLETFSANFVFDWTMAYSNRHWRGQAFFRFLNRMLFNAAPPKERYKVLEKFYRHSDGLIARFYSGRFNHWDKLRLLSGFPPVPITKAVQCFWKEANIA